MNIQQSSPHLLCFFINHSSRIYNKTSENICCIAKRNSFSSRFPTYSPNKDILPPQRPKIAFSVFFHFFIFAISFRMAAYTPKKSLICFLCAFSYFLFFILFLCALQRNKFLMRIELVYVVCLEILCPFFSVWCGGR